MALDVVTVSFCMCSLSPTADLMVLEVIFDKSLILTRNIPVSNLQSMKIIHKFSNWDFKSFKQAQVFKKSV
jgi:hypothetical protein